MLNTTQTHSDIIQLTSLGLPWQIHKGSNNCHNISLGYLKCTKINMVTIISMVTSKYSYSQDFASQAQPFYKEHHLLRINTHNTQHLNTSNNKKGDQRKTNDF